MMLCIYVRHGERGTEGGIHTETKDSIYDCQRPVRTSESSNVLSSLPMSWIVIVLGSGS